MSPSSMVNLVVSLGCWTLYGWAVVISVSCMTRCIMTVKCPGVLCRVSSQDRQSCCCLVLCVVVSSTYVGLVLCRRD